MEINRKNNLLMLIQTDKPETYNSISDFWDSMSYLEQAETIKVLGLFEKNDGEEDDVDLRKLLHEEGILALIGGYWNISDFDVIEGVLNRRTEMFDFRLDPNDDMFYITKVKPVKSKI